MADDTSSAQALLDAFQEELAAFGTLLAVLSGERNALLANDVDAVSAFAARKAQLVDRLREMADVRAARVQRDGFSGSAPGIQAWLMHHGGASADKLSALWQHLLDAARQARSANESNGLIVRARMQHNQGALHALQAAAQRLSLYGPDGLSSFSPGQRELGRA